MTTPDREHAAPATRLAGLGYHVLLEKPIAPTWEECVQVVEAAERAGVILAVCHVMRYTPYTEAVKQVVASGRLGQIVGVEHTEPVGWWHFAHAYVRGNWRRADEAGPSVLTKCCHDLDWLRFIVGRPPVSVSSHGGLHHFTAASRPDGAADRCLDCGIEPTCPYSASRLYFGFLNDPKRRQWPLSVVTTDLTERGVRQALREGPYGRCVYACDNDVADHQVTTIEFDGGVIATLTMSALTPYARRWTRIMGSRGFLEGDGHQVTVTDFVTGQAEPVAVAAPVPGAGSGHGGGDFGVIGAFTDAVATGDRSLISHRPARVAGQPPDGVRRRAQPPERHAGAVAPLAGGLVQGGDEPGEQAGERVAFRRAPAVHGLRGLGTPVLVHLVQVGLPLAGEQEVGKPAVVLVGRPVDEAGGRGLPGDLAGPRLVDVQQPGQAGHRGGLARGGLAIDQVEKLGHGHADRLPPVALPLVAPGAAGQGPAALAPGDGPHGLLDDRLWLLHLALHESTTHNPRHVHAS